MNGEAGSAILATYGATDGDRLVQIPTSGRTRLSSN